MRDGRLKLLLSADDSNLAVARAKRAEIAARFDITLTLFRARAAAEVTGGNTCPAIDKRFKARFPLAKKGGQQGPCITCGKCIRTNVAVIDEIAVPIH